MKIKYILPVLTCLILFSCSQDDEQKSKDIVTDKIDQDTTVTLTTYNTEADRSVQIFEITSSKKQEIKGKQGTVVTFPAGCFGKTEGNIKIELIECYSIQDMIFNGLSTQTTDYKLLEMDGMIYLNALNEEGDTLEIKQGKVSVKMPTEKIKDDIQVFEGVENNNAVRWNLSNEKLMNTQQYVGNNIDENVPPQIEVETKEITNNDKQDSIQQTQPKTGQPTITVDKQIKNEYLVNYVFNISKMGWINMDRFIEGETQDLFVDVSEEHKNVSFYLVLDNINSNIIPRNPIAVNGQFEFRNIPISEPFTLVALATKGDEIYFGMANHDTHEGTINCPKLKPVTRLELTDLLFKKFGKDIWNRPEA